MPIQCWQKEYCTIQAPSHSYTPVEFDTLSKRLQKAEHQSVSGNAFFRICEQYPVNPP